MSVGLMDRGSRARDAFVRALLPTNVELHDDLSSTLRKAEAGLAGLITVLALWLHFIATASAGGLWRDEANTVGLATLPTLGDLWRNLQYDSFPILWLLIVREVSRLVGPLNDPAFRAFGLLIGVGVVAVLWFNARTFRHSYPLVSLPLFAMSPSAIRWGDSLRAYGLGILLILLTCGLMWRLIERPTTGRFAAAALAAIAAVHTLFYNSVMLLAICAGGAAVCLKSDARKKAALVLLIGTLAAISIVPYAATIRNASSWVILVQVPTYTAARFWAKLNDTLSSGGIWTFTIWIELFVLTLIAGARAVRYPGKLGHSKVQRDVALFFLVSMLVSVPAVFLFLRMLKYPTEAWYYLTLLALTAVGIDALSGALIHTPKARIARLIGVFLLAAVTLVPALRAVRTRLTNIDLVASRLQQATQPMDFVVVNAWYNGVSFSRYFRASTPWETVPPLQFHRFHRYDLIKKKMTEADQAAPLRPLTEQVAKTLRAGHRVFIVGGLPFPPLGRPPVVLPPAPLPQESWPEDIYTFGWSLQVGYFVQQHALSIRQLPVKTKDPVNHYENLQLLVVEGWRPE